MSAAEGARTKVLLLAEGVREEWKGALAEGGLEVASTGWLDGVTAARLHRPDAVLLSADLPANARGVLLQSLRAPDLARIPVVVAGVEPDLAEVESPIRADRYVPAPVNPGGLAREVFEAVREGRVRWTLPRGVRVAGLLYAVVFLFLVGRVMVTWLSDFGLDPALDALLGGVALVCFAGAAGLTVRWGRRHRVAAVTARFVLAWCGLAFLWNALGPVGVMRHVAVTALLGTWLADALLGPPVHPGSRRWLIWYRVEAGALSLAMAAYWAFLLVG